MFTTPPSKKTMVNTRSMALQEKGKQHVATNVQELQPPATLPATVTKSKEIDDPIGKAYAESIVKSDRFCTNNPPSLSSRHSVTSKKPSSSSSKQAQKKKLELEADKAKARIKLELIDKQLAADIAELDEEYSPPSEASRSNCSAKISVQKWVDRSQQELDVQHATMIGSDKGKQHTPNPIGTDGPVQQLANALKDLVTSSTTQHNTNLLTRLSTPRDLPLFNGNPMEWLQFKQAYEESSEVCTFSEKENLWRLRKCLRGPAYDAVAALLISGTSPSVVMSTLELQFGNADIILSHIMTDIKRMYNIPPDYCREIVPFSIKVKNYVAAVRALGREEYLQGMEVATVVLSKLPTALLSKWADYSYPLITAGSSKPRLDLLSDFLTEEAVKISTCSVSLLHYKPDYTKRKQYDKVDNIHTVLLQDEQSEQKCRYCRKYNHKLSECKRFKKSLRKDRWQHVKRFGICYKCLVAHHNRETCPAPCCDIENCGQAHHRLLHYVPRQNNSTTVPEHETEASPETVNNVNIKSSVLLKVVPIDIHGPNGILNTSALLDDGSSVTLISSDLAARAGLRGRRESYRVRGAWDSTELVCDAQLVDLTLCGANEESFKINARIVDELSLPKQNLNLINCNNFKHLHNITHHLCTGQLKPQVLIGQDNYHLILPLETKMGRPNEPYATRTPLGWCLHGRVPTCSPGPVCHSALYLTSDTMETECILREIQDEVRRSFSIESMGVSVKPRQNSEDLRAESILEQTATLIDGKWYVGLPWRDEMSVMPNSFPTALFRLMGVERKMKKNEEYAQRYKERVRHLLENDYAQKLINPDVTPKTWYLPHFGVDNPNKKKLRLVFDAAAKTKGLSLNDYLIKGPDLLASLFGIMLRFRENRIAVSGDIKDMFLRVKIRPEDQNALRFVYRDKPEEPVDTYVMTSLIFGANCSPFIAQFVKNKNAQRYEASMPTAAAAIYSQHYMDDYIDSLPDEETAIQMVHEIASIHKQGNFEIRNWTSNSKRVLESLPKEALGEAAVKFKIGQEYEGERTLGLIWYPSDDTLRYDVSFKRIPEDIINGTQRPTKREMLRVIMSIFDVYGFLSPYTINGKIILQETWKQNINWDDHVTDEIFDKWTRWISQLQIIRFIRLPRYYPMATACKIEHKFSSQQSLQTQRGAPVQTTIQPTLTTSYTCLQMHIFCDASTKAMCAVAYWRWLDHNNCVQVAFITSRCRVAPVKPVSVPRLELQAAVLAARLAETVTLTPNHFLVGSSSSLPHLGTFDDSDLYLRRQWRISQRLADMYWRRWVKEILPDMLPRTKWQREQRQLQVGDLVLVVDPNGPRNLWPKGLVEEIIPGKDGRVRIVKVKTKSGSFMRSATRVARIPVDDECC